MAQTATTNAPTNLVEARTVARGMFADDAIVAVYFELPFGEVVVLRDGTVFLADEYDRGIVGQARRIVARSETPEPVGIAR